MINLYYGKCYKNFDEKNTFFCLLCPGHTFTDRLTGSNADQIPRITPEMTITIVRYRCTAQVLLHMINMDAIWKYTD